MGITCGILGSTGDGKSTSIVINPDGKCIYLPDGDINKAEKYEGMNSETSVIIASDRKRLPFPSQDWKNVKYISGINEIMGDILGFFFFFFN